jgi:hypothetical protein
MKTGSTYLLIFLLTFAFCLVACNSSTNVATSTSVTPQANSQPGITSLPLATQLAVGTLKLEGTDQAVTTEQAVQLLLLWQTYRTLTTSDTAAQVELEAVIQQIQGTMTPEQTQAIEAMQLTRQSVSEVLQALGLNLEVEGTPGPQRTPPAGFLPGENGGEVPGNGNGFGRGQSGGVPEAETAGEEDTGIPGGTLDQIPGNQNTPGANAQSVEVSPVLLEALVKMLETKAQSQMIIILVSQPSSCCLLITVGNRLENS